jgi:hypothetical protein
MQGDSFTGLADKDSVRTKDRPHSYSIDNHQTTFLHNLSKFQELNPFCKENLSSQNQIAPKDCVKTLKSISILVETKYSRS